MNYLHIIIRPGIYVPLGNVMPSGGVSRWTPDGTYFDIISMSRERASSLCNTYRRMKPQCFVDDAVEESTIRHVFYIEVGLGGC